MTTLLVIAAVLAVLVAGNLAWRFSSRRWQLPCPSWLGWGLEGGLLEWLLQTDVTLDRMKLKPGMRVLEIGPGPGRLLLPAAARIEPGGQAVGLDVQPRMIERMLARAEARGLTNVTGIVGDGASTALDPGGFDLVFVALALGEIPDSLGALRRAGEALAPQGRLCIIEVLPDPHFVPQRRLRSMAEEVGLVHRATEGRW